MWCFSLAGIVSPRLFYFVSGKGFPAAGERAGSIADSLPGRLDIVTFSVIAVTDAAGLADGVIPDGEMLADSMVNYSRHPFPALSLMLRFRAIVPDNLP